MKISAPRILVAIFAALLILLPESLHACSVCFGDPNSPLVLGAKYGVIVLALVIYSVLFSMAGVGYFWYRRAKALDAHELSETDAV